MPSEQCYINDILILARRMKGKIPSVVQENVRNMDAAFSKRKNIGLTI